MATQVDICNLALSYIGDRATVTSIDPPEGSDQADHCARFWPICLQKILAETNWVFATKMTAPAQLEAVQGQWQYAYAFPSDCLKIMNVTAEGGFPIREWTVMRSENAMAIYTHTPVEAVKYQSTDVPCSIMPSDFADALAHLLASKLAGAAIAGSSGAEMMQSQLKLYEYFLQSAVRTNALQIGHHEHAATPYTGDMYLPDMNGGHYGH